MARVRIVGLSPVVLDGVARAPGEETETDQDLTFLLAIGAVLLVEAAPAPRATAEEE